SSRRNHVEMREQQDRPARPRPAQPRHQITLAWCGREHLDIRFAEAGGAKSCGHGLGRAGGVTCCGDSVDLHKLFVDVDGQLLLSAACLCTCRLSEVSPVHESY